MQPCFKPYCSSYYEMRGYFQESCVQTARAFFTLNRSKINTPQYCSLKMIRSHRSQVLALAPYNWQLIFTYRSTNSRLPSTLPATWLMATEFQSFYLFFLKKIPVCVVKLLIIAW